MHNLLTIIIISYNSASIIEECLTELLRSEEFKILIVDNGSPDNSADRLKEMFPLRQSSGEASFEIIALEQNIGYGRAANVGLRKTKTPYALLLNPDLKATTTEVKNLLNHATADVSNTAFWGPAVKEKDFTGELPQPAEWISGCAMLFDVKKIKQIGLFDENIFLFFEETDLCYRTIQAGFGIHRCKDIYFQHLMGKASPPNPEIRYLKRWHYGWSRSYFLAKHNLSKGKSNPIRRYCTYRVKSWTSTTAKKRSGYRAKSRGTKAFIRGEKAFSPSGAAYHSSIKVL